MKRIVILQAAVLAVVALLSALWSGTQGLVSALLGGGVYFIPSCISVLLLKFFEKHTSIRGKAFVFGEILKVGLTLVFMLIVFGLWHESLVFLPFLFGLMGVSHLVFLVLLRVKEYGR